MIITPEPHPNLWHDIPNCCKWRGLFYPDGEKRCYRHSTPEDKALVAETEIRSKETLMHYGWPYGPNVDVQARIKMLNWAEHHNLRLTESVCQNLHWLRRGRCSVRACIGVHRSWMDHVTRWNCERRPAVLIAQPYGIGNDDIEDLAEIARDEGLKVRIDGTGWYGHGTTFIQIWRRDVLRA